VVIESTTQKQSASQEGEIDDWRGSGWAVGCGLGEKKSRGKKKDKEQRVFTSSPHFTSFHFTSLHIKSGD
jgi:hypothetical protein